MDTTDMHACCRTVCKTLSQLQTQYGLQRTEFYWTNLGLILPAVWLPILSHNYVITHPFTDRIFV